MTLGIFDEYKHVLNVIVKLDSNHQIYLGFWELSVWYLY